jgi:hypothetical protein
MVLAQAFPDPLKMLLHLLLLNELVDIQVEIKKPVLLLVSHGEISVHPPLTYVLITNLSCGHSER